MVKALILIELIKRRIGDLHQLNKIHSMTVVDVFQPTEEGFEQVEQPRRVTCFDCILSKLPLDNADVGYQTPEPKEDRPHRSVKKSSPEDGDEDTPNRSKGMRGR